MKFMKHFRRRRGTSYKSLGTSDLYPPDKLAVAEHSINKGHYINFKDTTVLARMEGYLNHRVKEAIKIWLHPNNFNREAGLAGSILEPSYQYILTN
jgi:hypothetical protein